MSIKVDREKCIGCGKCMEACPGNLLHGDLSNKAYIKYPRDCWGCTACLKECPAGAIKYYLGADIGGKGAVLYTKKEKDFLCWFIKKADGHEEEIRINRKESNRY